MAQSISLHHGRCLFRVRLILWLLLGLPRPLADLIWYLILFRAEPQDPVVVAYGRKLNGRLFASAATFLIVLVALTGLTPADYNMRSQYLLLAGWYALTLAVFGLVFGYRWFSVIAVSAALLIGGGIGWWLSGFVPGHISRSLLLASLPLMFVGVGGWSWLDKMHGRDKTK